MKKEEKRESLQMTLPFGLQKQDLPGNIISIDSFKKNKSDDQDKLKEKVIKKLIAHADSLDW